MPEKIEKDWDLIITPRSGILNLPWKDIWSYRDLLRMFVKRDIITVYKQTILGPIWYFLQPILTTLVFMFVFGRIAKISTDGVPQVLFYLSGITIWNYFQESFNATSKTFKENTAIFGKVYFPRLIMPLSKISSALIKFFIQLTLFIAVFAYYLFSGESSIAPNGTLFLIPVYLLIMATLGLGFGLIFTSLTVKYRDLNFLIQFGIQLLMYASPVIFPMSAVPEKYSLIFELNPLSSVLEGFRYAFLGCGHFDPRLLIYSIIISIVFLFFGVFIFNKTERNFIDTI